MEGEEQPAAAGEAATHRLEEEEEDADDPVPVTTEKDSTVASQESAASTGEPLAKRAKLGVRWWIEGFLQMIPPSFSHRFLNLSTLHVPLILPTFFSLSAELWRRSNLDRFRLPAPANKIF